ncbi:methyl-accepting chemotaxis protein [Paractinoplanes durhamensis]|uniref:methyl-accepting chemotaxis protein n=1 Tax=Paractinoplanes durhamensis TaxID=113563 RepID=UPI001941757C|nr:methyl-accepting chemotaxis protein [Actinoplanes durhamensis]
MPPLVVEKTAKAGWFGNLRVGVKITTAVAVAVFAGIVVAVLGLTGMSVANGNAVAIYQENLQPSAALANAQGSFDDEIFGLSMMSIATSTAGTEQARKESLAAADMVATGVQGYADLGLDQAQEAPIAALTAGLTAFNKVRDELLIPAAAKSDNATFAKAYATSAAPLVEQVNNAFDALAAFEQSSAAQAADDTTSSYHTSRLLMLVSLMVGVLASALLGAITVRRITRPLGEVNATLARVADGDLTGTVMVRSRDEVGNMAGSLNRATSGMRGTVQALGTASQSLAAAAEELSTSSSQIAGNAEEASAQAATVAGAAEEIRRNIDTVSAGSEQMGASIREIAQNANQAAEVAGQAVTMAETTNQTVSKLGESSSEIGNVIKLITAIAEQTNLLALNATIEAARAGELGKGFAVVASEVKDLAQETARATEDISTRVSAIQADTGTAITAIGEISEVIAKISDYQTTIAAAVEEQTATTGEMNRGVAEAASGVSEVATGVDALATTTRLTTESVGETQRAAEELARMSGELQAMVGRFRV